MTCVAIFLLSGLPVQVRQAEWRKEGVNVRYVNARKPYAVVDATWVSFPHDGKPIVFKNETPRGSITVTLMPIRESEYPPARFAEITWPVYAQTVVIDSPRSLPVWLKFPMWHPRTSYPIQINGRKVRHQTNDVRSYGTVWLRGGRNEFRGFYTDAE